MDYQKKINSKHEVIHPIVIWIIASILFHLLLALGIITMKMSSLSLVSPKKETQDHAILMMDEPKKQQTSPQPPAPSTPPQKKETKKEEKAEEKHTPKPSDYTLIPGRQGINKQNLDDPQNLRNMPKPEEQKLEKKAKIEKQEKKTEEIAPKEKIEQKEQVKSDPKPIELQDSKSLLAQPTSKTTTPIKPLTEFIDQEQKKSSIKEKLKKEFRTPIEQQDPYEFVPQPSRVVSFQDLNLGFDNRYATIGNNANLIQQGITIAAPDEVSLKHLTYYNQCAGMMKTAFATHPQTHLRQNATGKRFRFDLVVDRQGNQLELRVIQGSGDMILDRIISESIASVKMFPKVPSFIPDSPFIMRWTFLH